ncbi:MAG TPA: VCBS repeat-containing protein [Thermoanaerobaculia bacterium]|nr:VCBS repeat-containing protein [Thermoanaerobaculia bacterium]
MRCATGVAPTATARYAAPMSSLLPSILATALLAQSPAPPPSGLWRDATAELLPRTAEWTHKVTLADLDGDGRIDLLFANGGGYSTPGEPEPNRVFLNRGPGRPFAEASLAVFGERPDLARAIAAADLDGDGDLDLFVATAYGTPSRLFLNDGDGSFREVSNSHLPRLETSFGDVEAGDVDGDGDLDLVLADWGPGDAMRNAGGPTRLWLNDGAGRFADRTRERMPDLAVGFSWDLELADVDRDWDLDILVSCKRCGGSLLLRNDGDGFFTLDPRGLPQYANNYELEAMDLDGDGFLDLVTINDGAIVDGRSYHRREHVFLNDTEGRFVDATPRLWPDPENLGEDDNMVAFLDFDSDGDADFLIASLSGPDRLMINDGTGRLRVATEVFEGEPTPGTLGIAVGDLDGDHRLDVVMSQGEHQTAVEERIFIATQRVPPDTAPPVVARVRVVGHAAARVEAEVHDRKTPVAPHDFSEVAALWSDATGERSRELTWFGGTLWREAPHEEDPGVRRDLRVCAADRAGNRTCASLEPR